MTNFMQSCTRFCVHFNRVAPRCSVRGLKVFVTYSTYQSAEDRDKEKEREVKWAVFFQKLREKAQGKYDELIAAVEEQELVPEEIVEDDSGIIDKEAYPELRALQDEMNILEKYEKEIAERLFVFIEEELPELEISEDLLLELEDLGFEMEWISDPIKFNGGGEVYAGDYDGEEITHEFFYNRLKTVMGETEDC